MIAMERKTEYLAATAAIVVALLSANILAFAIGLLGF
jgi:hypothetical protein